MSIGNRDIIILCKIVSFCEEIDKTADYFGNEYEIFQNNSIFKNSIAMCVLQIGELSGSLTEDFKNEYNEMPWREIKGLRNFVAHQYGNLDIAELWNTVQEDIPTLQNYCKKIISQIDNCN